MSAGRGRKPGASAAARVAARSRSGAGSAAWRCKWSGCGANELLRPRTLLLPYACKRKRVSHASPRLWLPGTTARCSSSPQRCWPATACWAPTKCAPCWRASGACRRVGGRRGGRTDALIVEYSELQYGGGARLQCRHMWGGHMRACQFRLAPSCPQPPSMQDHAAGGGRWAGGHRGQPGTAHQLAAGRRRSVR